MRELNYNDEPDSDYRYFLYDPYNKDMKWFETKEEREDYFQSVRDTFFGDYWNEEVQNIVAGEITHETVETDRIDKPDDIDEDGNDKNGNNWLHWDYICNYKLTELVKP